MSYNQKDTDIVIGFLKVSPFKIKYTVLDPRGFFANLYLGSQEIGLDGCN